MVRIGSLIERPRITGPERGVAGACDTRNRIGPCGIGAVLKWAVTAHVNGFDIQTAGLVLSIIGLAGSRWRCCTCSGGPSSNAHARCATRVTPSRRGPSRSPTVPGASAPKLECLAQVRPNWVGAQAPPNDVTEVGTCELRSQSSHSTLRWALAEGARQVRRVHADQQERDQR